MQRTALLQQLDAWLEPQRFRDVAVNGLQVEGKATIEHVVCGVSANRDLIDAAIEQKADAIFVHHGLVWGGIKRIDGWLKTRIARLLAHDMSLFAYHLPLDAQPDFGNNAGLSAAFGMNDIVPFGDYKGQLIGLAGALATPLTLDAFAAQGAEAVGAPLAVFGRGDKTIRRVGLCSGGAPDLLHDAIAQGLDAFVTGEVTEWVKAVAEESDVAFLALGHHATERFGARNVAKKLNEVGVRATFFDVENPA